jgi:hypothetical protein
MNFVLFSFQQTYSRTPCYQGPVWDRPYDAPLAEHNARSWQSLSVIRPLDVLGRIVAGWFGRRPFGI